MSGRFDALTRIEQEQKPSPPPSPVAPPPANGTPTQAPPRQDNTERASENRQPARAASRGSLSPTPDTEDKPEKYSTLLAFDLKKKIKVHAAQYEMKDHEVIAAALTEYFQKHN